MHSADAQRPLIEIEARCRDPEPDASGLRVAVITHPRGEGDRDCQGMTPLMKLTSVTTSAASTNRSRLRSNRDGAPKIFSE